ncbi:unnamed protein product, partial [Adineta ricciae]
PPASIIVHDNVNPTSIGSRNRRHVRETSITRSDEDVRSCIRQLPPSPTGYTFSVRQRVAQFRYFKNKLDLDRAPDDSINLFNATVIAVLPIDAVDIVRRFVEALFITNAETNLNIAGRLFNNRETSYDLNPRNRSGSMSVEEQIQSRGDWCHNVIVEY